MTSDTYVPVYTCTDLAFYYYLCGRLLLLNGCCSLNNLPFKRKVKEAVCFGNVCLLECEWNKLTVNFRLMLITGVITFQMDLITSCKKLFKGRNSCSCSFMLYLSKDFITSREARRGFFVKYDIPYVLNLRAVILYMHSLLSVQLLWLRSHLHFSWLYNRFYFNSFRLWCQCYLSWYPWYLLR